MDTGKENPAGDFDKMVADTAAAVPGAEGEGATPGGGNPGSDRGDAGSTANPRLVRSIENLLRSGEEMYVKNLCIKLEGMGYTKEHALAEARRGLVTGPERDRLPEYLAEGIKEIIGDVEWNWKMGLGSFALVVAFHTYPHYASITKDAREFGAAKPVQGAGDGPSN